MKKKEKNNVGDEGRAQILERKVVNNAEIITHICGVTVYMNKTLLFWKEQNSVK